MVFGARHGRCIPNQRRIGEERAPRVGDESRYWPAYWPPRDVAAAARNPALPPARNRVVVHYAQRVAALEDVDPRQRTPGAADRIEGAAAPGLEPGHRGQFGLDDAFGALERFVREILQCQGCRAAA